jgi:hypothetical protein
MTLGELIGFLEGHPYYVIFYFFAIPFAAFLSNILGKGEGQLNPWCSFYAVLIYLSVIPGVFAILLNLYHILFENTSIYDVNIMVQLVPILSMFLSLYIIKKNVEYSQIPGFGKITAFASSIAAIMVLLFILDKARILIFSYIPFVLLFLIVAGIYLLVRYGYRFFIKK